MAAVKAVKVAVRVKAGKVAKEEEARPKERATAKREAAKVKANA